MTAPVLIRSNPGVKRDGTVFEGGVYIDALWCRFQRGLPRKIGGIRAVDHSTLTELVRGIHGYSANGSQYIHNGSSSKLFQITADSQGVFTGGYDRTPAGFSSSSNHVWQFEIMYDSVGVAVRILAHAAPNLTDIDNTTTGKIYYGTATATAALTDTGATEVSGGISVASPYAFRFGSNGNIGWSVANKPNDWAAAGSGEAFVTGRKIVKGLPLRGAGSGPASLFWSLDSLIRGSFVGGTSIWAFDTISGSSSVMSSRGIVEYDSVYFWMGVDRFLMFNGVVREVPNAMNLNWVFDNINYAYRQKAFAFIVPRWGEIWWCFPFGSATECTHAVIYNTRENTWYDTQLPDSGWSAGTFTSVYNKPFVADTTLESSVNYTLWQTETGLDQIRASTLEPIRSYFETNEISLLTSQEPKDKSLRVARIEPDFVQAGDMTVTVSGRPNARAPAQDSETFTFPATATDGTEETVPTKEVRRLMRFRFESNVAGGNYEMGNTLAHVEPADGRVTT